MPIRWGAGRVRQRRSQLDDPGAGGSAARRPELGNLAGGTRCYRLVHRGGARRADRPRRLQEEALTGTRTVLDVLVGEQQLFTSQGQLVTAQHDAAIAEFNVAAAIGRLIAPELKLPVRLYDMGRHYKEVKDKWIGFAGGLKE